jgi:hypothetical protein
MPQPLYARGKNPGYPLNRKWGGMKGWAGSFGEEKKSLALTGNQTPDHPVHSLVIILTTLSQLPRVVESRTLHKYT